MEEGGEVEEEECDPKPDGPRKGMPAAQNCSGAPRRVSMRPSLKPQLPSWLQAPHHLPGAAERRGMRRPQGAEVLLPQRPPFPDRLGKSMKCCQLLI